MNEITVEGVTQPNTVRWRLEVKRGRGGAPDHWRLYVEGVAEAAFCASFVDLLQRPGFPTDLSERVVRLAQNLFSRIRIGPGIEVVPFEAWDPSRARDGWSRQRLDGDCR